MTDELPNPSPTPAPPPKQPTRGEWVVGVVCGLLYALAVYGLTRWQAPDSGMLLIGFLVGAPLAACILAVRIADPRGAKGASSHVGTSFLTVTVMLVCAAVVLREGAVCLFMAGPIFYLVGIGAGTLTGLALKSRPGRLMSLSVLLLPLIGVPVEADRLPVAESRVIETRVHINAPPDLVWAKMTDIRLIGDDEHRWNFSHDIVGIPRPRDARMDGAGIGAVRKLEWAKGVRFEEHITGWEPGRELRWTFHITPEAQGRMLDEHLRVDSAYLRLEEGTYRITPTVDGGSDLVLTTRYWIRTPMNAYAAFWGKVFLGDFHRNVLAVIKDRAEAA